MTFFGTKQFQICPKFHRILFNPRVPFNLSLNLNRTKFHVTMDTVTSPVKEQGSTVNTKSAQLIPARFGA